MKNSKAGFTLVELVTACVITGMLAAITLPSFSQAREKANRTNCQTNLRLLNQTTQQYLFENNYPGTLTTEDLKEFFFREVEPVCPSGGEYAVFTDPKIIPTCTLADSDQHTITN